MPIASKRGLSEKIHYSNGLNNSYGWLAYLYEQEGGRMNRIMQKQKANPVVAAEQKMTLAENSRT